MVSSAGEKESFLVRVSSGLCTAGWTGGRDAAAGQRIECPVIFVLDLLQCSDSHGSLWLGGNFCSLPPSNIRVHMLRAR